MANIHFGECIIPIDGKTIKEINDEIALAQQSVKMDGEFKQQPNKATLVRIILQYKNKHYLIGVGFIPSNIGPKDGRYEIYHQESSLCARGFLSLNTQPPTELNTDLGLDIYNQVIPQDLMEAKNPKLIRDIAMHTGDAIGKPGAFSCNELGNEIDKMFHAEYDAKETATVNNINSNVNKSYARNIILSGPPGVGKSYIVDEYMISQLMPPQNKKSHVERITITPSTTYEDFFGCYKPQMKGDAIVYDFSEGVFCKLLKKAFAAPDENFVLIVEELNRADTYDVFGQVFQLLDRKDDGSSSYQISMSKDAQLFFQDTKQLQNTYINPQTNAPEIEYELWIPDNMYIICTMNSADQGVHMLDTAFKRRFEMIYIDINGVVYAPDNVPLDTTKITTHNTPLVNLSAETYHQVRKEINTKLQADSKITDDKMISEYFLKTTNNRDVSSVEFIVKILGYLLQNVYKSKQVSPEIFNATLIKNHSELSLWRLLKQKSWEDILNPQIAKIITDANKD